MKTSELFRKTLKMHLDSIGHGAQAKLADELGIDRGYLNGFLNGRKMLSESKREEISEKLGYSYVDFLIEGTILFNERTKNFQENPEKSNKTNIFNESEYSLIADLLAHSIEIFEDSIAIMFEPEISLKVSLKVKAKVIINIYRSIAKKVLNSDFNLSYSNIDINILISSLEAFNHDDEYFEMMYNDMGIELGFKSMLEMKSKMIAYGYVSPNFLKEYTDKLKSIDKKQIKENLTSKIIDIKHYFQHLKRAA